MTPNSWIEGIGEVLINLGRRTAKFGRLGGRILAVAFQRQTYNSAVVDILYKQIYFTAIQVMPLFLTLVLILTVAVVSIIVSLARQYGLTHYATDLVMGFAAGELIPLFTAILVALRSGSAINSEVALMRVNRELDAFLHCDVDPIRYEFFPRIVGGMVSVVALAGIGVILAIVVAFFAVAQGEWNNFETFSHGIGKAFSFPDMLALMLKCALFGVCVTLIPIAAGMETPRKPFAVPISVLRGMMGVFLALLLVEVASLALKYM